MTARLECLIIADDLTGACDAAVPFAVRGYSTSVRISEESEAGGPAVLSLSTDSRDQDAAEIVRAIRAAATSTPFRSTRIVFKKIDSTLRGQVGTEIQAALEAFECDAAVICPAFPGTHRIVEGGRLQIAGSSEFEPVSVTERLQSQGLEGCAHIESAAVGDAILGGARFLSLDAGCDGDLDRIAATCMALPRRILWVGSAGMAGALARSLPVRADGAHATPMRGRPVLFGIGSNHPVTVEQQERLLAARRACRFHCDTATPESIASALQEGTHVLLRIPRGQVSTVRIVELIANAPAGALVLSGGDTANFVCRSTGVRQIHIRDEVVPGVPYGFVVGGKFAGMPVVTKSGGFGDPETLIRVADHFSCWN